jgi:hypothetical protein
MVRKNKENLINGKKSIYYDLKEFYNINLGVLYSYQDFEKAGIQEFNSVSRKMRPLQDYEKNIFASGLIKILLKDIFNDEKLSEVNGYITLNPIINYYESFIMLFKEQLEVNKDISTKINTIVMKMVMDSDSSEEIKLGLILAPICNIENVKDILNIFSIHNDYLFYVIKAYEYIGSCNNIIFEFAKKSNGYGKVFCVMSLKPTTSEIRKWLIEEGSDNDVGVPELLSYSMLSLELLDYLESTEFDGEETEVLSKSFSRLFSDYGLDEIKDGLKVCDKLLEVIDKVNGGIYSLYAVISILYSIESIIIDDYKAKGPNAVKLKDEYKIIIENCKNICKKDFWHEIIASEVSNIDVESSVLISCAEKTNYKLKKKEFELMLKRDSSNPLLYKYAFAIGNQSIKKCAFDFGLKKLSLDEILSGQEELKIETLAYENIAQICFFIIIKYSQYEDFQDKYKQLNLRALKAPLIETRVEAANNLQRFREEFDSLDKEIIDDAISAEMVGSIRRALNSLLIKTENKEKKYIEVSDNMHIDEHVKDIYLCNIEVAGTSYVDMNEVHNKLLEDNMLYLKRENNNVYDSDAIVIITPEGYVIGYVPKENNFILKNLMDKGKYLYGKIKEISDDYSDINIEIYLSYKDIIEEITGTLSLLSGERDQYLQ